MERRRWVEFFCEGEDDISHDDDGGDNEPEDGGDDDGCEEGDDYITINWWRQFGRRIREKKVWCTPTWDSLLHTEPPRRPLL